MEERVGGFTVGFAEDVLSAVDGHHALVNVHRTARLALHGLGHEGGIHLVADRHLADGAFEQKDLVGQRQWVTVVDVDLHLCRSHLVDQRVELDALGLAPVVHHIKDVVVLVDGVHRKALHAGLGALGAAHRWLQRNVFVGFHLHQVELHLGRHHRLPAFVFVELEHAAQHVARRQRKRRAVECKTVVDDLRRGLLGPGHRTQRVGVGLQEHVRVGHRGEVLLGVVAGHGHGQHRLGQAQAHGRVVFVARHDLAARLARHVGDQAFDFGDAVFVQPLLDAMGVGGGGDVGHGRGGVEKVAPL